MFFLLCICIQEQINNFTTVNQTLCQWNSNFENDRIQITRYYSIDMCKQYLVLAISSGAVGAVSACLGKLAGAIEQGKWWLQPLLYCLMVLVRNSRV